ncbi:hypothetical protein DFH06DRAFT_1153311 [Mycena polygramma]|nr:hypothetical protein DFH06DRAFT_1153311 [Mycena polygramma]
MITTSRDALLSTSAFVAGHRTALEEHSDALEAVRRDTELKLQELHQRIMGQETQVERTLIENLRILRAFGSTEAQLEQLTQSMASHNEKPSPKPEIPPLASSVHRSISPLDEFQEELNSVLSPRTHSESADDYYRRGAGAVARRGRTAASFNPEPAGGYKMAPSASAVQFAKTARFEDPGSISTANVHPLPDYHRNGALSGVGNVSAYATTAPGLNAITVHTETFTQEQEKLIRRIAHREIGEVLNLPPHIRSVNTDAPPKYKGEDDLDVFMKFVELECTWLRAQMLCGYDRSVDKYCTSILKSHLEGDALDWFILTISNSHFIPDHELTFTDMLCALHQRFITSANAQRATRAFDAVRFDASTGPDKFAEALLKRAQLMRHNIRYKIKVDKEMTAEFTPFSILRTTARHLFRTMNEDSPHAGNPRTPATTKTVTMASTAPRRPAAPTTHSTHSPGQHSPAPVRASGSEDTRTCYKCGIMGHIGTNPKCPRFSEPSTVPGARVGAQRVLESYSDGGLPDDDFAEGDVARPEDEQDYEGLWGGEQYEDKDPNTAPDLADLVEHEEPEGVRVGAIRAHYYSMRIPEPIEETEEEAPELAPIPGPEDVDETAAILDFERLELCLPSQGVYHEWDAAEEARQNQVAAATAALRAHREYPRLLADFKSQVGNSALTAPRHWN